MYHTDNKNSNFYPRPPRGGRRTACSPRFANTGFLSTPSARRATRGMPDLLLVQGDFYPRPPRGGRHLSSRDFAAGKQISIHALREEGDVPVKLQLSGSCDFYPRPPRGGRLLIGAISTRDSNFYPRPPRGGRRRKHSLRSPMRLISIHALREEGDMFGF